MTSETHRHRQTTDLIACPACSEFGAVTWMSEEIHAAAGAAKKILTVTGSFRIEASRLVCERCDVILPF